MDENAGDLVIMVKEMLLLRQDLVRHDVGFRREPPNNHVSLL